jgi:hypothetical protein
MRVKVECLDEGGGLKGRERFKCIWVGGSVIEDGGEERRTRFGSDVTYNGAGFEDDDAVVILSYPIQSGHVR